MESISSISDDDDDSSLSDNDYIIVPLPDCFDINKPLTRSMMSSFASSDDREVGMDDNHNTSEPVRKYFLLFAWFGFYSPVNNSKDMLSQLTVAGLAWTSLTKILLPVSYNFPSWSRG